MEKFGAVYWVRTSGLFFRPLLETCPISEPDWPEVHIGGFQCVIPGPNEANSVMKFLMLDEVQHYELGKLRHDRRLLIKKAAKQFAVRPIQDGTQFREQGFQAYRSFYQRTRYHYKSERVRRENYDRWVDSVLKSRKTLILGAYDQREELRAVSLSYWVGHTLSYATFFADTAALQKGVGARRCFIACANWSVRRPEIREVFVRRYAGGQRNG